VNSNPYVIGFLTSLGAAVVVALILNVCSMRVRLAFLRGLLRLSRAGLVGHFPTQRAATPALHEACLHAKDIRILAVRAWSVFPVVHDMSQLGHILQARQEGAEDCTVRVLLLSPVAEAEDNSKAFIDVRESELDKIRPRDAAGLVLRKQVAMTLRVIADLKENGLNCVVRLYNELPVFKIFIFDDIAFIGGFNLSNVGRNNPTYQVRRNEGLLFDLAERYFEYLWQDRSEEFDLEYAQSLKAKEAVPPGGLPGA
jgi:hypothetical protein